MLRIQNSALLKQQIAGLVNEELFISELLTCLLGRRVTLSCLGDSREIDLLSENWLLIQNAEGLSIALNMSELNAQRSRLEYYSSLGNFSDFLYQSKNQRWSGLYITDPFSHQGKLYAKRFRLRSTDGVQLGSIDLALPDNFSIFYGTRDSLEAPGESQSTLNGKVNIRLGALQISLEEFLNLRDGVKIECEFPDVFDSVLEIGDNKLAKVVAKVDGGKITIEITELFA